MTKQRTTRMTLLAIFGVVVMLAGAGCGQQTPMTVSQGSPTPTTSASAAPSVEALTPLVGSVPFAPVPFAGSDGKTHLVYELAVTNFTGARLMIGEVKIVDDQTGSVIGDLDAAQLADRLQPAGSRNGADHLEPGQAATIFIHLAVEGTAVPETLAHEVSVTSAAMPPGSNQITERLARTKVDERTLPVLSYWPSRTAPSSAPATTSRNRPREAIRRTSRSTRPTETSWCSTSATASTSTTRTCNRAVSARSRATKSNGAM